MKSLKQKVHRSSKSGRFVSAKFAKRHKATTERQTIPLVLPKKKRR